RPSLLVCSRTRLHPISTLFPYTTLFRSRLDMYLVHWPAPEHDLYIETYEALEKLHKDGRIRAIGVCNLKRLLDTCEIQPVVNQIDRKSTRLNSSHVSISYAVFCLKKKKQ